MCHQSSSSSLPQSSSLKIPHGHFCTGASCKNDRNGTLCRGEILPPLFQISQAIVDSDSLSRTLSLVLNILGEKMGVTKGIVNLFNRKTGKIFIYDSIGLTEMEKARGIYRLGEGITGKVVESGQAIVVPRIHEESDFLDKTRSHAPHSDQAISFICVPIVRGKKVLGTISAERPFAEQELLRYDTELLGIIASLIAQAVELYLIENEEMPFWKMENERLQNALREKFHPSNIIGTSKPMLEVYSLIEKIAKTRTTVLLLGKSGVGKELVANAIHYSGLNPGGPLVKFNCAALPESIVESELFGHERGAFTGASASRKGRFEEADGGTIFLDEVGELSLPMQAKLLRVLQERTFERVGGNKVLKVDIRVIAATNRDLSQMVAEGTFREDLYYRLSAFPIMIPSLCKRGSDILTLADHFVRTFAQQIEKDVKGISTAVQEILLTYSWPGNVRELENVMERAVILTEDNTIHVHNLPLSLQAPVLPGQSEKRGLIAKLDSMEYEMIVEALTLHKGNITEAARELNITRRALGIRMEKFDVNYRKFRGMGLITTSP